MVSIPDEVSVQDRVKSLNDDCAYVQKRWRTSEYYTDLLEFLSIIKVFVLPGSNILIENALCLGLGSLGFRRDSEDDTEAASPRGRSFIDNLSFHQSIIFKITVNALSKKLSLY